jgi:putative acetyltransferase
MATGRNRPAPIEAAIRPITPADDPAMAAIIRAVMTEHGAVGAGCSIHDAEVDRLSKSYAAPRSACFVIALPGGAASHAGAAGGERIVGGAGIAPLAGCADPGVCELRKMYFLPEARGLGLGQRMLDGCLAAARGFGFTRCYLETLATMGEAARLYERNGFVRIAAPLGHTGHFGCDRWYVRRL